MWKTIIEWINTFNSHKQVGTFQHMPKNRSTGSRRVSISSIEYDEINVVNDSNFVGNDYLQPILVS